MDAIEVLLEQMQKNAFTILVDDYFDAEYRTYGFDKKVDSYYVNSMDTLVGSYNRTDYISESEMRSLLNGKLFSEFEEWKQEYFNKA